MLPKTRENSGIFLKWSPLEAKRIDRGHQGGILAVEAGGEMMMAGENSEHELVRFSDSLALGNNCW